MVAPHSPYSCSRDLLAESLDMAKELNIPIHIHVAETKEESGIILKRYGKRPLTFLEELGYLDHPSVFAHGVELNEREIERLATSQVSIAHNPISNLKLASGIAPIIQLQKQEWLWELRQIQLLPTTTLICLRKDEQQLSYRK